MDLGLLGLAARRKRSVKRRLLGAASAVTGALVLDVLAGIRASRRRPQVAKPVAITILASAEVIDRFWRDPERHRAAFFHLNASTPKQLRPAPGGRGTEVLLHVDNLITATRVRNDLRRLKQLLETGELTKSPASRPSTEEELQ
jgi:hypothetical protein